MAIKFLKLPLFGENYYSYSVNLEGNKYVLEFLYVSRVGGWFVTLKDSEQNVLVRNQRLSPNTLLFSDYKLPNLTGAFYCTTKSGKDPEFVEWSMKSLSNGYDLYYIYNEED